MIRFEPSHDKVVKLPGKKEHFDMYLSRTVFPVLTAGMEELAREIQRFKDKDEAELGNSLGRFNPCCFLAEYLMRNNPRHGASLEFQDAFDKYSRLEQIRRIFILKKAKISKHFDMQPYKGNFKQENVPTYIESLDSYLQMGGKLVKHFPWKNWVQVSGDHLEFSEFYEGLSKWAVSPEQKYLNPEDFDADYKIPASTTKDFKRMTDRVV